MSPGVEKMTSFRWCFVGFSGAIPYCHQRKVPQRCSLCGVGWTPLVVGPQLLKIHWQVRLVPGPAGCKA